MTNPTTDEAAVSLIDWLKALAERQKNSRGDMFYLGQADPEIDHAIAFVESLRAQLTAVTQRAEQAERMLAEAATSLEALAESCTLRSLRGIDHVPSMRLQQQALRDARRTLTAIRSAASGEQG